jgi:hypothetical protein
LKKIFQITPFFLFLGEHGIRKQDQFKVLEIAMSKKNVRTKRYIYFSDRIVISWLPWDGKEVQ